MEKEKYLKVFMGMWQETGVGIESIITIHTSFFKFGHKAMMDTGEIWTMCLCRKGKTDGKVLNKLWTPLIVTWHTSVLCTSFTEGQMKISS